MVHREVQRHHGAAVLADDGVGRGVEDAGALIIGHAVDPGQAVAGREAVDAGSRGDDGQLQRGGAVAAVAALGDVGRRHGGHLGVGAVVPLVPVAGRHHDGGSPGLLDGEGHVHRAVATRHAREGAAVVARGGILHTLPEVAAAGDHAGVGGHGLAHCQGQVHRAVAAVDGLVVLGVGAAVVVVAAVPDEVAAGGSVDVGHHAVVQRQGQGHRAVAAAAHVEDVDRRHVRRHRVGAVVNPGVAVAGRHGIRRGHVAVDGQVQGHRAVAEHALGNLDRVHIGRRVGALVVGHAVNPRQAVAGLALVDAAIHVVQRQVQRGGAVAAPLVGGAVDAIGRGVVDDTVPQVGSVAGHHSLHGVVVVVDREVQVGYAVATHGIHRVEVGHGAAEVVNAVPGELLADRGVEQALRALPDGQVQRHSAVAAGGIGGMVGIVAGDGIHGVVPPDAVADIEGVEAASAVADGELQRHRAVAVIGGLVYKGGSRGGSHRVGAVVPGEAVADTHRGVTLVDVQGEGGHEKRVAHGRDHQGVGAVDDIAQSVRPGHEVVARRGRGDKGVLAEVAGGTVGAGHAAALVAAVFHNGGKDVGDGVEGGGEHGVALNGDLDVAGHGVVAPGHEVVVAVGNGCQSHLGAGNHVVEVHAVGGDNALGHAVAQAHLSAVSRDKGQGGILAEVDRHGGVAGHGVGSGNHGVAVDHAVVVPVRHVVGLACGRGHEGHGAVGHHRVGAVGIHLHIALSGGNGQAAHGRVVGHKGHGVGVVQEVGHKGGVADNRDSAHLGGAVKVVPVHQVMLRVGHGGDAHLGAGLHRVAVEALHHDAVGDGGHAGHGKAAAGGHHSGNTVEGAAHVHIVARGAVLGDHALAAHYLTDGALLVPLVRESGEVGGKDGLVAVHGVAGIALEVHAAVAVGMEGQHGIVLEVGIDHKVAVGYGYRGNKARGGRGVAGPRGKVVALAGDGKHADNAVSLHTVDIGAVLLQVHHAGGKLGGVLDGQLVDVDVLVAGAADGHAVAENVDD